MADSVNGGNSNPAGKPQEMSMEMRLLLAFLLMGAVMFFTPYLFKTETPQKKTGPAQTAQNAQSQTPAPATPAPEAPAPADEAKAETSAPVMPATVQQPQPPFVIDTARFRITFNNQGATVRSWQLKAFKGNDNKTLELTN